MAKEWEAATSSSVEEPVKIFHVKTVSVHWSDSQRSDESVKEKICQERYSGKFEGRQSSKKNLSQGFSH